MQTQFEIPAAAKAKGNPSDSCEFDFVKCRGVCSLVPSSLATPNVDPSKASSRDQSREILSKRFRGGHLVVVL